MPITFTPWVDDDGTGTIGTLINEAVQAQIYADVNAAVWDAFQLANVASTPFPMLRGFTNLNVHVASNTTISGTYDWVFFASPLTPYGGNMVPGAGFGVNLATAGPAANARDQASVFSASNWIYFYLIYNPTIGGTAGVAAIASLAGPPTGPTLPSGYTQWAYMCAYRWDGSSHLVPAYTVGGMTYYQTQQSLLSVGTAATETSLNTTLATLMPPNSATVLLNYSATGTTATTISRLRFISGSDFFVITVPSNSGATGIGGEDNGQISIPTNVAQTIYYLFSVSGGGGSLSLWVSGYSEDNGAR